MSALKIGIATVISIIIGTIIIGGGLIVQTINQIYKEWTDDF